MYISEKRNIAKSSKANQNMYVIDGIFLYVYNVNTTFLFYKYKQLHILSVVLNIERSIHDQNVSHNSESRTKCIAYGLY